MIRFDHGVKNNFIADAHIALRMNHSDSLAGSGSVRFGSSPTNPVYIILYFQCHIAIRLM